MSESSIFDEYRNTFSASHAMFEQARRCTPGGVSQHQRYHPPFPVYVERAHGARKWSIEGRELIDYWMGHSALVLGHGREELARASLEQLERGSHFSAPSRHEVELARLLCDMVPGIERVRFCGTGSEATYWALQVARAVTSRPKFVQFAANYHGWFEQFRPAYSGAMHDALGEAPNARDHTIVLPPNDLPAVERALRERTDIAAVILAPAGGGGGSVPHDPAWVRGLRELTKAHGVLLVFDEIISGFRAAPGGYQVLHDIRPDLTTYGKALFGGMPGGAVAGTAALMDLGDPTRPKIVPQAGTWNAWPVACAAGVATLKLLRDGSMLRDLEGRAALLRSKLNEVLVEHRSVWKVYGEHSILQLFCGRWPFGSDGAVANADRKAFLGALAATRQPPELRVAMFLEGLDLPFRPACLSFAHELADLEQTQLGFARALRRLAGAGVDAGVAA